MVTLVTAASYGVCQQHTEGLIPGVGKAALDPETHDKKIMKNKAAWVFMSKVIHSKLGVMLFHLSLQVVQCTWFAAAHPAATHDPATLLQVLQL